jgi:hypothetical protein
VASTYVNNLRLEEMTTGEKSGTWGNITNTNLQLVGQALGYGTRAIANAPTDNITIADGASDADRSMYLKLTGGGQACTVTLLPNTSSKMWIMENATSYTLTFTQGSGANVAILAGQTKMIFADGLGAGAVVYELGTIAVGGVQSNGAVTVGVDDTGHDVTFFGATAGKKLLWDESADALIVTGDGTFQGLDTSAISGIVESNANFIDMCLVGPSVDGKSWNGYFSNGTVWTSLMLATVETSGSDAQVNIWDLTAGTLASATPLATLTLTGATATDIAAAMGYVIVSTSDQGVHVVDPHGGSWAERTVGWPRSLTTSTTPALTNANVQFVCAGLAQQPPFDPRTGGPMPSFGVGYGAGADIQSIVKHDGNVWDLAGTVTTGAPCFISNGFFYDVHEASTDRLFRSVSPIDAITADDWSQNDALMTEAIAGMDTALDIGHGLIVGADAAQLVVAIEPAGAADLSGTAGRGPAAAITTTFNTGFLPSQIKLAALANSKTADRSGNSNTLTENGTVTEAAVETGAELLGYSGFASGINLTRGDDADYNSLSTGAVHQCGWLKCSGNSAVETLTGLANAGNTIRFTTRLAATGTLSFTIAGASTSGGINSTSVLDDGEWHRFDIVRRSNTELELWVDGVLEATDATAYGSISGTILFAIGVRPDDGSTEPAATTTLSLIRLAASAPSSDQIRKIYEAEKGMFVANAKCLLQGASDAVLDARIDPLTGKYIVTQSDTQDIFDGLAIETERTIATGGTTFEHGLLWGDAVAEINDANLFASTPATDQRQVNEMVRSLSADLPAGIDLGKAKAYYEDYGKTSASLVAGYNIESIARNGTGDWTITFAIPFKTDDYIAAGISNGDIAFAATTGKVPGSTDIRWYNTSGAAVDARGMVVFFGELENE